VSKVVVVSNPLPPNSFFNPLTRKTTDWAAAMPPMMVTDKSALFEIDVEPRHWSNGARRVACYRLPWEGKDCFFLAPTKHLTFPMTPQKLFEHSVLVLTVGGRETVKDRYFDEDSQSLRDAIEAHLDVEYVHAL
jgi:hypothetical protein